MKVEINLSNEDIEAIANLVIERLKPLLNGKQDDDDILDIEQASRFLNKSKGQIYQWVNLSKYGLCDFPYMKLGKSLRFSRKALLEWMQKR